MTQTRAGTGQTVRLDALRAERARVLARRGQAQAAVATRSYLVCACGADRFGLPLAQVAQVLPARPVTALPGAPPAVLGLIALGGRVVSLLALAPALGRGVDPAREDGQEAGHVVVVSGTAIPVAVAVGRVLGVAEIPEAAIDTAYAEAGLSAEAVSGYAPAGAGPGAESAFVIIDLPRLVRRYHA
ncbi:chemotaxis protein CheW [Methylobacterium sp. J-078]|uniref:chemotaxis protein CheW n=1 Tax=Methylobacterium sp. J-078 TaxID=2836657 RepID=UPI001FBACAF3|nr:chemotaxis protein CheW [Methylobacterium sp. J-078]MCJ2045224.1 chemotaxis protein CheW [Methylobacterium sp. J-078]